MSVRFGTDGVRGPANEVVTAELALALGRATVRVFPAEAVVVGRDTRESGPMLAAAVAAGVAAEGADAVLIDVVPTPAVAAASAARGVPGVMISASHNPFGDNGLKVFGPGGGKLTDAQQRAVEAELDVLLAAGVSGAGGTVGAVRGDESALGDYATRVQAALEGRRLDGLRVVVDCANGSNAVVGPVVLRALGADVAVIADQPDGRNINDQCGSTHPELLQAAVVERGADLGIAFDGDADRVLAVDETGNVVDGDQIIALCALDLRRRGRLAHDTVVVTVMTNLGFRQAMSAAGITVVDTAVGDRYVLEAINAGGYSLGGEQSGHIIFGDLATTGDGLLSAVMLADLVVRSGASLADLAAASMTRLPQVLRNVRVAVPVPDVADRLADEIAAVTAELGDTGRVLLRPSGTEPVVRVMAEAPTDDRAAEVVDRLALAVEQLVAR
ncbi:MAG: phosphoglucosamine mutase [Actinomycetes bacterium]